MVEEDERWKDFPSLKHSFMLKTSRYKQERIHIACWVTLSVKEIRYCAGELLVCFVDGHTLGEACTEGRANPMGPQSHYGF